MRFFEFIYVVTWRWMERQGRERPQDNAQGILIFAIGMYAVGAVSLIHDHSGFDAIKYIAEWWPFDTQAKYLRPTQGLGLMIAIATGVVLLVHFRERHRAEILASFVTVEKLPPSSHPYIVMGFFALSFVTGASLAFHLHWLALTAVACHCLAVVYVYHVHGRGAQPGVQADGPASGGPAA